MFGQGRVESGEGGLGVTAADDEQVQVGPVGGEAREGVAEDAEALAAFVVAAHESDGGPLGSGFEGGGLAVEGDGDAVGNFHGAAAEVLHLDFPGIGADGDARREVLQDQLRHVLPGCEHP